MNYKGTNRTLGQVLKEEEHKYQALVINKRGREKIWKEKEGEK